MSDRQTRSFVTALLRPEFEVIGFKRQGDEFESRLGDNRIGVVTLGLLAADHPEVLVTIGVRFAELEGLVRKLYGYEGRGEGWTVGRRLCDLMPSDGFSRPTVQFSMSAEDRFTARRVADSVREYGLPFMHEWSSLSKLIDHMSAAFSDEARSSRYVNDIGAMLPAALWLAGRREDARVVVEKMTASLVSMKNRGYAHAYSQYAQAFRTMLAEG